MDIVWRGNKPVIIDRIPQWKKDHAKRVITAALEGGLRFDIKSHLPPMKKFKSKKRTHKWLCEHEHDPTHDHFTVRKWRLNLKHVRDALKLLYTEGIITGYHVDGAGNLRVNWFDKYQEVEREIFRRMPQPEQEPMPRSAKQAEQELMHGKIICGDKYNFIGYGEQMASWVNFCDRI